MILVELQMDTVAMYAGEQAGNPNRKYADVMLDVEPKKLCDQADVGWSGYSADPKRG